MRMETGFGWMRVGKTTYDHDIIIHVDGQVSKRKKKASKSLKGEYGHTPLSEHELDVLESEKPERVFIGTGNSGALPLTPGAKKSSKNTLRLSFRPLRCSLSWKQRGNRTLRSST